MGFRFRKSISLGKLLKLNISKSGIGVSGGVRGVRLSVAPDGKVRGSVGLPGTGMSYTKVLGDITPSKKKAAAKPAVEGEAPPAKKAPRAKTPVGKDGARSAQDIAADIPAVRAEAAEVDQAADVAAEDIMPEGADDTLGIPAAPKGAPRRFCTSCGNRAAAKDKFCRYCGARVPTGDPDEE